MQCFVCPSHGIDNFIKNVCSDKEEIGMQSNEAAGIGAAHVDWDVDFFWECLDKVNTCVKAVTVHHKTLALFRAIGDALTVKPEGGIEPKKYGDTRFASRIMMAQRMHVTQPIYRKLMVHDDFESWLARQNAQTKQKVCLSTCCACIDWLLKCITGLFVLHWYCFPRMLLFLCEKHASACLIWSMCFDK